MLNDLAEIVRPKTIEQIVGQSHLKPLLKRIVSRRNLVSLLLFGNPGIGKTSLAIALATSLEKSFTRFNAATDNKKMLQEMIANFDIVIIDEVHRLNKDKQDILLPHLEGGKVTVYATTVENPYFIVNPAVRSRMHILELKPISDTDIATALQRINDEHCHLQISNSLLKELAMHSNGDMRRAVHSLNLLSGLYQKEKITKKTIHEVLPSLHFASDKKGTLHYDYLSAFHKTLRGTDPDAVLYYLAYLIRSGDYNGIFRRLLNAACEDIGLASPPLVARTLAAINCFERIGHPEGHKFLALAALEITLSPKSNAVDVAITKALRDIDNGKVYSVPNHLRDNQYASHLKVNQAKYKYPHDYGGYVEQQYLPKEMANTKYWTPGPSDQEKRIKKFMEIISKGKN